MTVTQDLKKKYALKFVAQSVKSIKGYRYIAIFLATSAPHHLVKPDQSFEFFFFIVALKLNNLHASLLLFAWTANLALCLCNINGHNWSQVSRLAMLRGRGAKLPLHMSVCHMAENKKAYK